jgi:hypothetical protein
MKTSVNRIVLLSFLIIIAMFPKNARSQHTVTVDWNNTTFTSRTTPTLQLVENPMVRPGSPIHKQVFKALKDLQADYVRYVPWFPYPKMAVAELAPPTQTETFWDFTYLDSTMHAFMTATQGHDAVINFSTTPAWMWETSGKVEYPADPYKTCWNYNQGTRLRDETLKEVTDYYVRLFSWYTRGGFTDELGKFHRSGHHYKIAYWEVLNEPDLEHHISPQLYTRMYDAIVSALKKISPGTKFVGISVAFSTNPEWFEYFLNPANHKAGVPIEGISYHHYSNPSYEGQPLEAYQYTFFEKADAFLDRVRYIENIRKRLAPQSYTMINELGVILRSPETPGPIDDHYWNLAGAMYAHLFLEMTRMGIDVVGESQLVGYPTQFPDVSMVNWTNGNPNARYWVLKLLIDHIHAGDKLVKTDANLPNVDVQAFSGPKGKRILLINRRNARVEATVAQASGNTKISYVDIATGENPPARANVVDGKITLEPFSVAVVEL